MSGFPSATPPASNGHELNKLNKARIGYPQQLQEEEKKNTGMLFYQFWGSPESVTELWSRQQEHPGEKVPGKAELFMK